jgi:hypothetical protein
MASLPQASPPTPRAHLYPPPYAPHALPISRVVPISDKSHTGGNDLYHLLFLTAALVGGDGWSSRPDLSPLQRKAGVYVTGGCIGRSAGLGVFEGRNNFPLPPETRISIPWPGNYTDYAIPVSCSFFAYSQNREKRLSASSRLSIRPSVRTNKSTSIRWIFTKTMFENFLKICRNIQVSLKSDMNNRYLYENLYHKIEVVRRFKYLGTVINEVNDEMEEIRARILAVNKAYSSLQTTFRSKQIHRNKIRLYRTLIKPILCYSSVTWTLTQTSELMLNTFERKILRRIYGPTHEGDASVRDGIMNCTAYTRSQILWITSELED